jgi:hypothetical protein
LLRSATLSAISPACAAALTACSGPGTYVDLRTEPEIERDGEPAALWSTGWTWHRAPVRDKTPGDAGDTATDSLRRYQAALPRYLEVAREVAALLATGPVLVACSLGKDRTGLVVALVLTALSVERAWILRDFSASNDQFPAARRLLPPRWRDDRVPIGRVDAGVCAAVLRSLGTGSGLPVPAEDIVRQLFSATGHEEEVACAHS